MLVHSGAFAKFVGKLDLVVHVGENNNDPEKRSRVTSFTYTNIPIDSKTDIAGKPFIPNDPRDLEPDVAVLGQDQPGDRSQRRVLLRQPATADAKVTRNDLSGGDSQLGNLVARSMQLTEGVEAEFAITNSLGIRADFERGPLTIEQMFNVFPFENTITVMYLSGVEVQETLDFVAQRSADRGCRTQAQVSGIAFDMVCNGECRDRSSARCAKNVAIGDNCRNGEPDGEIDFNEVRAARSDRPLSRRGERLHRGRWLGLPGAEAQHVEAGHRHLAA